VVFDNTRKKKGVEFMKKQEASKLRNVALVSHGGAGKTTLAEALLFISGTIPRQGQVDQGNTICDYEEEEVKRKISINSALAPLVYKEHKINLIDTPGYDDFVGEVKSALSVVELALLIVSGVSGVEVGTERVWQYADEYNLPKVIFVNHMDKENSNFYKTWEEIREKFGVNIIPFQLPVGKEANFKGIVDLIKMKAYLNSSDKKVEEQEIPEEIKSKAEEFREKLIEGAAESDDALISKYLEEGGLSEEEVKVGLKKGIKAGKIIPLLCGSALKNIGGELILDVLVEYAPSPEERGEVKGSNPAGEGEEIRKISQKEPFSGFVFKTTTDPYVGKITFFKVYSGVLRPDSLVYNPNKEKTEKIGQVYSMLGKTQKLLGEAVAGDLAVTTKLSLTTTFDTLCDKDHPLVYPPLSLPQPIISLAIEPKSKVDEEKLSTSLTKLQEEDLTFKSRRDGEIKQTLISGRGELHLGVVLDKLQRKFGVKVDTLPPKVPYKETIKSKSRVQGKYKKQSGGRGQYGDVWLELESLPRGEGFQFVDKIVGGAVPRNYIPSVEKGIREALQKGVLAGYLTVDFKATLYDGSYHPVDSSDMAFQIAGSMAFKKGVQEAKPVLLEPIMSLEVTVPKENMGDIIGDLNGKRGRILGTDAKGDTQIIKALVPQAEVLRYAISLRSLTQGRGSFEIEFSHYEEVPASIAGKIIEKDKKEEG